ncbi:MAG: hypothetical protein HY303_12285 [Candidatus Wallbacteria bacterium]|nr:hypothetical protein [Candidatus Wallbacteria bacterium]
MAAGALEDALSQLRVPHMLIGGLAVIGHGLARATGDVDATFSLGDHAMETVLAALAEHGIAPRDPSAIAFALRHHLLKLRHLASETPIDLSLAWLPFEEEAMARAKPLTFGDIPVLTVTVDDLIVYKAVAWRDRDNDDIGRLAILHGDRLDLQRIRHWVGQYAEVLEAPERLPELETLLRRARGKRD